jgi:hypothetical protein
LLSKRIAALRLLANDGYDSSARLALRSDSGAINRHLWLDATLDQAPFDVLLEHARNTLSLSGWTRWLAGKSFLQRLFLTEADFLWGGNAPFV